MAGYSGTPLIKKLGFKAPMQVVLVDAPRDYRAWLGEIPTGVKWVSKPVRPVQAVHLFATDQAFLKKQLAAFRKQLQPDGFLWVSWPKKAAKIETDITEDVIRALALPLGFVDIKVCAVNEVWSGLKFVIRRPERRQPG
jgi:hypothetical protein